MYQKPMLGERINWAHPLAKGLVGCWVMNEGSGDKTFDLSGNENTETFVNSPVWVPDGIELNNTDYLSKTSMVKSFDNKSQMSLVAEIKPNSLNTTATEDNIISFPEAPSANGCQIAQNDDGIQFGAVTHDDFSLNDVKFTMPSVDYYKIAQTYDGVTLRGYNYGLEIGNHGVTLGTGIKHETKEANIGIHYLPGSYPNYWAGIVKYVYAYDRALSPSEIAWLYHEPYAMFESAFDLNLYRVAAAANAPTGVLYGPLVGPLGGPI